MIKIDDFVLPTMAGWRLRRVDADRRPLFHSGDVLTFAKVGNGHATLDARFFEHGQVRRVLGAAISLSLQGTELVGTDYGRILRFWVAAAPSSGKPRLFFEADYLEGSAMQPGEGGDGDPEFQFPP